MSDASTYSEDGWLLWSRDQTVSLVKVDRDKVPPAWSKISDEELVDAEWRAARRVPTLLPRTSDSAAELLYHLRGLRLAGFGIAAVMAGSSLILLALDFAVWLFAPSLPPRHFFLNSMWLLGSLLVLGSLLPLPWLLVRAYVYDRAETANLLGRIVTRPRMPRELADLALDMESSYNSVVTSPLWRSGDLDAAELGFDPDTMREHAISQMVAYTNLKEKAGPRPGEESIKALAEFLAVIEEIVSVFTSAQSRVKLREDERQFQIDQATKLRREQEELASSHDVSDEVRAQIAAAVLRRPTAK